MSDRRSEIRLEDAELAVIAWQQGRGAFQQLGNIENLSLNGAGVIVDEPIPIGTTLLLTYGEGELTGVVRRCDPLEEGHFIGVEFTGQSRGFNNLP